MGWTAPRTWTDGELVTKAIMDVHIRDNQLAEGPHLIARKTADESDAVGTLQNDDHLFTPSIPANEVWRLDWHLWFLNTADSALKLAVTFPSGTFAGSVYNNTGILFLSGTPTVTNTQTAALNTSASGMLCVVTGLFTNGGTPGAVTLQWARVTSGTVTIKANSSLWGVKLA
jgi:hypothetical protein